MNEGLKEALQFESLREDYMEEQTLRELAASVISAFELMCQFEHGTVGHNEGKRQLDALGEEFQRRDTELQRLQRVEQAYLSKTCPTDEELRKEFEEMVARDEIDLELDWDEEENRYRDNDTYDAALYYGFGARRGV